MVSAPNGAAVDVPALEAAGVSKRYGDRDALSGVDLVARPGVLHGLLGPNGAGKTTLMRVLLGLVRRDAGSVRLFGRDRHSRSAPLPDGVAGFVETPAFYPYLSGRRNLTLLTRLDNHPGSDRRQVTTLRLKPPSDERAAGSESSLLVSRALDEVGLSAHADVTVAAYSAGMRQRLGIASALLRAPRLLFLDEPTSSLDPAGARDVRALARRLADEGAAVVWSSHDMSEVEELCTVITVINHGRVVFAGGVDELRMLAPAAVHRLRTSDDHAALDIASGQRGMKVRIAREQDGGLDVSADTDALDAYVITLARAGVAVRTLERRARSLESLFLELTGHADAIDEAASVSRDASHGARVSAGVS